VLLAGCDGPGSGGNVLPSCAGHPELADSPYRDATDVHLQVGSPGPGGVAHHRAGPGHRIESPRYDRPLAGSRCGWRRRGLQRRQPPRGGRSSDQGRGRRGQSPPAVAPDPGNPAEQRAQRLPRHQTIRGVSPADSPPSMAALATETLRKRDGNAARLASSSRQRGHEARCDSTTERSAGPIAPSRYTPSSWRTTAHSPVPVTATARVSRPPAGTAGTLPSPDDVHGRR
jgi:hypothetical protein